MKTNNKNSINRRKFIKDLGIVGAGTVVSTAVLTSCNTKKNESDSDSTQTEINTYKMTYRKNPKSEENVSLLGFGMMRLPSVSGKSARETKEAIDQELVNEMVDYAIEHGVNYFDTSPTYCRGDSEISTGIALSRHPRNKYFVATKLSNFAQSTWSRENSIAIYHKSFKNLQVDYIDYYLLHAIGSGNGMKDFEARYINNGMLDFLLEERKAGRIRNLGFSYHGDIAVFDSMISKHDVYKWDFVQIQLNYLDWKYAKEINEYNTNAEYLYGELEKRKIPAVIMEPLLGGRLSNVPNRIVTQFKQRMPESSVASWAFRFAGTHSSVLTVLSGMTQEEHLSDNLKTLAPLKPLTNEELDFLQLIAKQIMELDTIPCNDCKYCMPCPYGLDIPAILMHYNKCINDGNISVSSQDKNYRKARQAYLIGYDRSVPKLRQASHCIGCNQCSSHCPQQINIPQELHKIDSYVEDLKQKRKF